MANPPDSDSSREDAQTSDDSPWWNASITIRDYDFPFVIIAIAILYSGLVVLIGYLTHLRISLGLVMISGGVAASINARTVESNLSSLDKLYHYGTAVILAGFGIWYISTAI